MTNTQTTTCTCGCGLSAAWVAQYKRHTLAPQSKG